MAVLLEIGITAGELMLTEPAATIRRKRGGMDTLKHEITRLVDHIGLRTGIAAPKHIDDMLAMGSQSLNGSIRKLLPTQGRVAIRLMGSNGQRGIQKQHALLCPTRQITTLRNGRAQISLYLLEDILQRWRKLDTVLYRKAQSMGLSGLVVGILTDNHHLHLVERTQVKGIEDQFAWRIASILTILCTNRIGESDKIRLVELTN